MTTARRTSRPGRTSSLALVAAVLVAAAGAVLFGGTAVHAHAGLVDSSPLPSEVLDGSPSIIELRFSEPVDPVADSIRVVAADGSDVELGPPAQSDGATTIVAEVLEPLADGTYAVSWRAVSADSHPIRGAYLFSVGAPSTDAPDVGELLAGGGESNADSFWLGVGRWASYGGIGALLGSVVVALAVAPATFGTRRLGTVVVVAGVVGTIGTVVLIAAQAVVLGDGWNDLAAVLDTRSGTWWAARAGAIALLTLAAAIFVRSFRPRGSARRWALAAASLVGLVVSVIVALGGHATTGDAVPIGVVATTVHVAAMAVWLGGLCVLGLVVARADVPTVAARFSPVALGSVVALAASGTANTIRQVGSWSLFTESSYGRWLIVKLVLVGFVVLVAVASRVMLRAADDDSDATELAVGLRRSVIVEVVGIAFVLAATAGLVNSPPVPEAPPLASASAVVGDKIALVELDPAVTGGTEMHVTITSPTGTLERADEITVTADLADRQIGPIGLPTIPVGPNHVVSYVADFPIPGTWTVTVTARYGEFDQVVFRVELPVVAAG